jgi:ADP-ribose pyrophosphatase YjhB (NUDIX family)
MSKSKKRGGFVSRLLGSSTLTWLWGRLPLNDRARTAIIWLLSPKFIVGVVGFIRDEEGRVLLLKHTYRRSKPWGLPAGGMRPGESLEECLRREIKEETGLVVEIDHLLSAAAHYDRRLVDMIFACHPVAGSTLADFKPNAEVSEARYFPPDQLPEGVSRGQRRLIKVACEQADNPTTFRFQPGRGDWVP